MVKKLKSISEKKTTSAAGLMDGQLASSVKDSAQQIWLAGMGAFSKAQEEGGKVFDALVKEGMSLQKKTQGLAEDKISEVTGKMSAMAAPSPPRLARTGTSWSRSSKPAPPRRWPSWACPRQPTSMRWSSVSMR
jgi:hypothetical protein